MIVPSFLCFVFLDDVFTSYYKLVTFYQQLFNIFETVTVLFCKTFTSYFSTKCRNNCIKYQTKLVNISYLLIFQQLLLTSICYLQNICNLFLTIFDNYCIKYKANIIYIMENSLKIFLICYRFTIVSYNIRFFKLSTSVMKAGVLS